MPQCETNFPFTFKPDIDSDLDHKLDSDLDSELDSDLYSELHSDLDFDFKMKLSQSLFQLKLVSWFPLCLRNFVAYIFVGQTAAKYRES